MTDYKFSDFSSTEANQLHSCLSPMLDISKSQFDQIYQSWRVEFEQEDSTEITLPRQTYKSVDSEFQQRCDQALLFGADLPTLLEQSTAQPKNKTIAILGQDPLRKGTQRVENITFATPYGMHLKMCRERLRNTRIYFGMIKVLLEQGYRVYLTDIFKIWVSQESCDDPVSIGRGDRKRFIQVLHEELSIMKVSKVITWGTVAKNMATKHLQIQPIAFPHPSGSNNGTWAKVLGKRATEENKIDFWTKGLSTALDA